MHHRGYLNQYKQLIDLTAAVQPIELTHNILISFKVKLVQIAVLKLPI
ncbi:hypothetical protein VCRA2119O147_90078 [Vibrio crassostreae]|uniref:Uncharacterized protein n=1 Tax=Vibrio crassostreae TaxID=246167 RepID=A0ABM9QUL3_9VIBR|nr:hypothetical protein VCRA2113O137_130042 [Vibrio crassostreae]CAK1809717.1 hypothetical protein VCRA2110O1_190011 [Vibrio crassostreae]CAK1834156.1 hypothetical protein VCRA2118O429_10088 [Vibrio crassostreae]CAK1850666.1 hypothetical protein VCRA2116O26_10133 [Vibrio crassostreae]CAK1854198.1 hypothetical protein VCRA2113O20_10168 [Vibrio crassostreae]